MKGRSVSKKEFSTFLWSVLCTSLAQNVDYITDPLFAGNIVCQEAIAAMNLYGPLLHLSYALLLLLVQGSMMLAANSLGNGDKSSVSKHFTVSFTSMVILYSLLIAIVWVFRFNIVTLLCPDGGLTRDLLYQYLSVVVFEMMAAGIYLTLHYFISIEGHPELSGNSSVILVIIQVALSFILSKFTGLGVRSFAAANIIAEVVAITYLLYHYYSKNFSFRLVPMNGEYFKYLKLNLKKGLPQIIHTLAFTFALLFINQSVQIVSGEEGIQAWSFAYLPISFGILIYLAVSEVVLALGEIKLGENDSNGLKYIFKKSTSIMINVSVAIVVLSEFFPDTVMQMLGCEDTARIDAIRMPFRCSVVLIFAFTVVQLKSLGFIVIGKDRIYSVLTSIINLFPSVLVCVFAAFFKEWFWLSFTIAVFMEFLLYLHINRRFRREYESLSSWDFPQLDVSVRYDRNSMGIALSDMVQFLNNTHIVDDSTIDRMEHACEELMYNIIKHGSKMKVADSFSFRVFCLPESIEIIFKDAGRPYNPVCGFSNTAADADASGQKMQLAIRMFNHFASNPQYKFCYGLNMTRISFQIL